MKQCKSFLCLIALVAILLCSVGCSCENGDYSIDDVFSQLVISESDTDEPAFAEHIYVIIPNGCSGELSLKARELADGIESKTGIFTSLKYDNELTVAPKNSCEILLGSTNRLVSDNAMDILRDGEYLCRWDDGAIVICGRSDASSVVAVDRFINEILPIASKYSLMPDKAHFELMGEYAIKQIIINGYDLYDYVLIYPDKNENGEKNAAYIIRDFINSQSGYFLEVVPESEITSKTVKIIQLSCSGDKNVILPLINGISLNGTDAYALSCVASEFIKSIEHLSDSVNGIVDLRYENTVEFNFVDTDFESTFWFSKPNSIEPFRPNYELINYLRAGTVGVCIVANPNKNLREDLELSIKTDIKSQDVLIGDRTVMIIYDERKVNTVSVTVDDSDKYLTVEVETAFGEKISYIYIVNYSVNDALNEKITSARDNVITFYENCEDVKYDGVICADEGEFVISNNNNISYSVVHNTNLYLQNSNSISSGNENKYSCILKTKILHSKALLDYALK